MIEDYPKEGFYRGFRYQIRHNSYGNRLGYLSIPDYHPWFLDEMDQSQSRHHVHVHGGVTYCGPISLEGGWWVGFDCGHANDRPDPRLIKPSLADMWGKIPDIYDQATIKDDDYVRDELHAMIDQAWDAMSQTGQLLHTIRSGLIERDPKTKGGSDDESSKEVRTESETTV